MDVCDLRLMCVLYVARRRLCGSAQECLDHLAAGDEWMPMSAFVFRHYRPTALFDDAQELEFQVGHCLFVRRGPIDESDDRRVAAAIEDLLQPDLKGTE